MEFDCTKPLGDDLKQYMMPDLKSICAELALHGIIYESQFPKLWSMVCKQNCSDLARLFSETTRKCIYYVYDNVTFNFVFYDMDKYSVAEAIRLSIAYQSKMN